MRPPTSGETAPWDSRPGDVLGRRVVRSSVMRGTQHLVAASDFLWLRPLVQPALDRGRQAAFGLRTAGMDLAELAAAGRALLQGRTFTRPRLRDLLAERWPDRDPEVLAWSVQYLVPLVHPPPSGTWGDRVVVHRVRSGGVLVADLDHHTSADGIREGFAVVI